MLVEERKVYGSKIAKVMASCFIVCSCCFAFCSERSKVDGFVVDNDSCHPWLFEMESSFKETSSEMMGMLLLERVGGIETLVGNAEIATPIVKSVSVNMVNDCIVSVFESENKSMSKERKFTNTNSWISSIMSNPFYNRAKMSPSICSICLLLVIPSNVFNSVKVFVINQHFLTVMQKYLFHGYLLLSGAYYKSGNSQ